MNFGPPPADGQIATVVDELDEPVRDELIAPNAAHLIDRASTAVKALILAGASHVRTEEVVAECIRLDSGGEAPSLEAARFAMIAHAKRTPGTHYQRGGDDPAACVLSIFVV